MQQSAHEVPLLPLNEDHSSFHPANLVTYAINGLASLEAWRRRTSDHADARHEVRMGALAAKFSAQTALISETRAIDDLRLAALVDPDQNLRPLNERLNIFHLARAEALGSYVTSIETDRPRFAGVKKWVAEKRQNYHQNRARKAANVLLTMN